MRVIVLGANGRLGREVVDQISRSGHQVTAFVRRMPDTPFQDGVNLWVGDACKHDDLARAFRDQDIIVNAIGAGTLRRNDVESSTTAVAVTAARESGVSRYIAMSAGMVAVEALFFKYVIRPLILRNINQEHLRVEAIVKASQLQWTILRPPRLTNGPSRGSSAATGLAAGSYSMSRKDVAGFIAEEIDKNRHPRQVVHLS